MATGPMNGVIQRLRRSALLRAGNGLSDGQLLDCFLVDRDETAAEALVVRHGPMVLGVCRRILGNVHDAEDAFQAVFLVLVRKAATIRPRDMVGNWLHGVARRTALKARAQAAKRRAREKQVSAMPNQEASAETVWQDVQPLLDQEVQRLPEKYRTAVILCDLHGKSQRDAARQLGWPPGTLSTRLARARAILAQRLTRRGVALSAATLALSLSQQAASACVPAPLLVCTVKAATLFAAGPAATAGVISAEVAALTQGVIQAMFMSKLKSALMVLLLLALLGTGAGIITHRSLAGNPAAVDPAPGAPALDPVNLDEFFVNALAGDDNVRKEPSLAGKVVSVAKDAIVLETPAKARGEEPTKHDIKIKGDTKLIFSGVGLGGAKIAEGQHVQVWFAEGSKDTAASAHFMSPGGGRSAADVAGRISNVSKDGKTLTFTMRPLARGEEGKTIDIRLTDKTVQLYSWIAKGGTKPAEGYVAEVWLARGSKDTAAKVSFAGDQTRPERGEVARPDSDGKVASVSKDGKVVTLLVPPQARGEEATKRDVKVDDKTQFIYLQVGPDGDRPTEGYHAKAFLAEGAKETAAKIVFMAVQKDATLRGKVVGVAKGDKGFTIEMPATERGADPKRVDIKITDNTKVVFQGVGPDGAKLAEDYVAQVWLEPGSPDTAALVTLGPAGQGGRRRE